MTRVEDAIDGDDADAGSAGKAGDGRTVQTAPPLVLARNARLAIIMTMNFDRK
jgi:hypothetical protein